MTVIKFNNNGIQNIEFLIKEFDGLESTDNNIAKLRDAICDSFYNNPYMDFSTKSAYSFHLYDRENDVDCGINLYFKTT